MDRRKAYPGQGVLEADVLLTNRFAMVGLGKLAGTVIGLADAVSGLACTPGSGLTVSVGVGEVYQVAQVDPNAYSSLAADTTHTIFKQGILADAATINVPAPGVGGQSINYLIEAQLQEIDTDLTVLPYYNVANPSAPYSGPNNDGTSNSTTRKDVGVVQAKAGVAAATGSQTTPAVDAGSIALYVVTVANGQSSITAANIATLLTAPFISRKIREIRRPAFKMAYAAGQIL